MKPPDEQSLATRNLLRGNLFRLPSGEQVAHAMGIPAAQIVPVTDRVDTMFQAAAGSTAGDWGGSPLWLYVLCEAEVIGRARSDGGADPGEGLGPVGARIVAEVLVGLLEADNRSYLGANRNWRPDPRFDSIGGLLASTTL